MTREEFVTAWNDVCRRAWKQGYDDSVGPALWRRYQHALCDVPPEVWSEIASDAILDYRYRPAPSELMRVILAEWRQRAGMRGRTTRAEREFDELRGGVWEQLIVARTSVCSQPQVRVVHRATGQVYTIRDIRLDGTGPDIRYVFWLSPDGGREGVRQIGVRDLVRQYEVVGTGK